MKPTRLSRLTIRARLTLVYGGLFLLAGLLLLGVTYALISQQLPRGAKVTMSDAPTSGNGNPSSQQPLKPQLPEDEQMLKQQVAEDTRQDALAALLTQGGIALAVVSAAAIALGWLLAARLLQPLQRMTETARRIADAPAADRGLHERIALDGPHDELRQLADTFDIMLERLDHAFDGQRRFIANASHELRTPLALNRALLEVAVHRKATSPEVRQLGETLLEINLRHERLLGGLLLLARSEPEVADGSYVDLADIVEHVVAQLPPSAVTVQAAPQEAPTTGDPILLERLVQNLVDNAVRHNLPNGGWARVTSDTTPDGQAVVQVSNTGPVIPSYEIPSLFEPFRRLGGERLSATSQGAGLGLSRTSPTIGWPSWCARQRASPRWPWRCGHRSPAPTSRCSSSRSPPTSRTAFGPAGCSWSATPPTRGRRPGASAPTPASRTPQPGLQARRGGQGHRRGRAAGHLRSGATPDRAAHEPGTGPLRHPHGARAGPGGALDYGAVAVGYRYRSSAVPGAGGYPRPLPPAQLTGQLGSRAPTCRSPSTAAGSPP